MPSGFGYSEVHTFCLELTSKVYLIVAESSYGQSIAEAEIDNFRFNTFYVSTLVSYA